MVKQTFIDSKCVQLGLYNACQHPNDQQYYHHNGSVKWVGHFKCFNCCNQWWTDFSFPDTRFKCQFSNWCKGVGQRNKALTNCKIYKCKALMHKLDHSFPFTHMFFSTTSRLIHLSLIMAWSQSYGWAAYNWIAEMSPCFWVSFLVKKLIFSPLSHQSIYLSVSNWNLVHVFLYGMIRRLRD